MPNYRFAFHGEDEHVTGEENHSCAGDDAAMRFANTLLAHHVIIMVWCGERFVKRIVRRTPPPT